MSDSHPSYGTIRLDGFPFKVSGGMVGLQHLATFQRKSVDGDYSADSHPVISTKIYTDLTGGHGVVSLEEGADQGRYRFGVADPRKPRQITLPPYVEEYTFPSTARPLGAYGGNVYAASGTDILVWDEATKAWTDTTINLSDTPLRLGTIFKGNLYIPFGEGYDRFDGSAVTPNTDYDTLDFVHWDNRFIMLAADGHLYYTFDGTTWETDWGDDALLDDAFTPIELESFRDQAGMPMPIIVTDQGTWAFDPSAPGLYRTDDKYPRHPDFGRGATTWRGDLFVPVGMGVFRNVGGTTRIPMGLDRDHGLPPKVRGKIVDLLDDYNGMWALVSGVAQNSGEVEDWEFDSTDDEWVAVPTPTVSSLHIWTGYGWHCYWMSGENDAAPSFMAATTEDDAYRVWWGVGDMMYSIQQSLDFANARALIESGTGWFAETGYIEYGEFDAAMVSYTKIANSVLIRLKNVAEGGGVRVSYRVPDISAAWSVLGEATANGQTVFEVGDTDEFGINVGVPFLAIELRTDSWRAAGAEHVSESPLIDSLVLSYLKILPEFASFQMRVDMTDTFEGHTAEEQHDKLHELLHNPAFHSLEHAGHIYRVRIAGAGGMEFAGQHETRATKNINIIQIRSDL